MGKKKTKKAKRKPTNIFLHRNNPQNRDELQNEKGIKMNKTKRIKRSAMQIGWKGRRTEHLVSIENRRRRRTRTAKESLKMHQSYLIRNSGNFCKKTQLKLKLKLDWEDFILHFRPSRTYQNQRKAIKTITQASEIPLSLSSFSL